MEHNEEKKGQREGLRGQGKKRRQKSKKGAEGTPPQKQGSLATLITTQSIKDHVFQIMLIKATGCSREFGWSKNKLSVFLRYRRDVKDVIIHMKKYI